MNLRQSRAAASFFFFAEKTNEKIEMARRTVLLNGEDLIPEVLFEISKGGVAVDLSEEAWKTVKEARQVVDDLESNKKIAVYGVNTGFGNFANVRIPPNEVAHLQLNLIRSHCAGVGEPLSPERTRMLLALRINTLAKGYSGVRAETLQTMIAALNSSCLSRVPCKGTLGASGDLAPLAHLALGLIGEGEMWNFETKSWSPSIEILTKNGIKPLNLASKEGLCLINGTQMISALGCEAVCRARTLIKQADIVAALTLEVLKGSSGPFDPRIHRARPHKGQILTARRIRRLLAPASEIQRSHRDCCRVQDSYTLRCTPQVHGIVHDTVEWVYDVLSTEINSATDNPMVMLDTRSLISCGNFHGEYPAKALDYFAIGIHELSQISERRIERLVNSSLSELPAFLVEQGGLNSGFMIPHCTAAALVSENKVLCHPSSADSIPTSAAKEDHVSMGGMAARKALEVVENVEKVVAIELLCAVQALDFCRPLHTTAALERVYDAVRAHVPYYGADRTHSQDIEKVWNLLRDNKIWEAVNEAIDNLDAAEAADGKADEEEGRESGEKRCEFGEFAECEHKKDQKRPRSSGALCH